MSAPMRIGPAAATPRAVKVNRTLYRVVGVAEVEARPHRSPGHAQELARRIAKDPDAYLAVARDFNMPGVHDLRPWFGGGAKKKDARRAS